MALTIVVLSAGGARGARLTFDGTQRVVIGRGAGSDVRLPDASVSLRHATLRAQGSDFVVVDEESTNGTFVGSVAVAARTSRIVRSGDRLRLGRMWLELRIGLAPITRDVAAATRDIALALVAQALDARGEDKTTKLQVVEGPDQGTELRLSEHAVPYLVGRGGHCALPLADADVSREHLHVQRRSGAVFLIDAGTKNGTWLGDVAIPAHQEVAWRPPLMVRIGRTVLALHEPAMAALAAIEGAMDERLDPDAALAPPDAPVAAEVAPDGSPPVILPKGPTAGEAADPMRPAPPTRAAKGKAGRGWSVADAFVMGAALCVLALSLAGLVWLLRG
jgi:pSer/pThr/pTyr-binding forkhead associated (FHA) protein